jgi:hypothetical protein
MSDHDERWLDAADPADAALDALLAAGRAEQPSAQQLQALAERLEPTFNPSGPGGSGGGGEGGDAGSGPPATIAASIAPTTPIAPAALVLAAAAVLALCGVWAFHSGRADDAGTSRAPAPVQAPPAAPIPPPRTSEGRAERSEMRASSSDVKDASVEREHEREREREREHVRAPSTKLQPAPHKPAKDAIAELALLEQAHRALAGAPAKALAAVEAHARRFPASQYAQERELIAIEALLALTQVERARVRGERFLALYPRSSHGRKVRSLIASSRGPAALDGGAIHR